MVTALRWPADVLVSLWQATLLLLLPARLVFERSPSAVMVMVLRLLAVPADRS